MVDGKRLDFTYMLMQGFHWGQFLAQACFWYINDLLEPLTSLVCLFVHDTAVYHLVVPSTLDRDKLQQDLKLQLWEKSWDCLLYTSDAADDC